MPPKIVYGKRRNGDRQAFNKFLSPEKDDVPQQHTNRATRATKNWQHQLQNAAMSTEKPVGEQTDISMLEKGFESLQIEQTQATGGGNTKRKSKPRKAKVETDTETSKENNGLVEDALEQSMQALVIDSATEEKSMVQKPGRPRKVLSDRNINALEEFDCPLQCIPNKKKGKRRVVPMTAIHDCSHPVSPQPPRTALPTPQPTPEPEDLYTAHASPLLALSDRKKIVAFQDWSNELDPHFEITKIAEASFSEVYRLSALSLAAGVKSESVLKLVALKTPPGIPLPSQLQSRTVRDREGQMEKEMAQREEEDQWKSHVEDVFSEVKLLQNLTHIPGFTVFRDLTIVQGRPSTSFNNAWKSWNKSRPRGKKSEFPDPSKKTSYDESQLWAVVEMQDAGTDCEKIMEFGGLTSIWEVWEVFWGVAISVGKAEEACQFEHRDLHLGNICVRSSRPGADIMQPSIKDPLRRKLRFTGLDTTVIDYTLSRADVLAPSSRRSSAISSSTARNEESEGVFDVAYLDLNKDPALFQGDASEEYQYEIYRYMRGAALFGNPLQSEPEPSPEQQPEQQEISATPRRSPRKNTHIRFESSSDDEPVLRRSPRKHTKPAPAPAPSPPLPTKQDPDETNIWHHFHPKTNLVWLHFLLHKLLNHLHYHGATPDKLSASQIMQTVCGAQALVKGEDAGKVKRKAVKLYGVLQRVGELLCPVELGRRESLGSVKELVVLALEERWVRVGDVAG
ncbi:hypothetical protein BDW02DRAFT_278693 [Decorospora gaudefroyi]|uniref:non-specific serine/threonine protein kinase n=1 Tax=Decorospora gaudefroyi TaxID=184978 RepID=A0A6A5KJ28_9PLEO|nr:hypothetical protein BDW02DRAFT_278693 [Decorospora gaudefroyi]